MNCLNTLNIVNICETYVKQIFDDFGNIVQKIVTNWMEQQEYKPKKWVQDKC